MKMSKEYVSEIRRKGMRRNESMKKMFMIAVMVVVMIFMGTTQLTANAASKKATNKKALKAYEKLLSKKSYKWSSASYENKTKNFKFCVIDVNKDGIKDLLLQNDSACHASGYYKLLTYHNGKVKCLLTADNIEVYKKAGIVATSYASTGTVIGRYYKVKNGKTIEKASFKATDTKEYAVPKVKHKTSGDYPIYYYSCKINNKEVSYKKYNRQLKKLLKKSKSKATKLEYHTNVKTNREAYIK